MRDQRQPPSPVPNVPSSYRALPYRTLIDLAWRALLSLAPAVLSHHSGPLSVEGPLFWIPVLSVVLDPLLAVAPAAASPLWSFAAAGF